MKASLNGGAPATIEANAFAATFAIDATDVYWTHECEETPGGWSASLMKAPKTGGAPVVLATYLSGSLIPLTVDETSIYLAAQDRENGTAVVKLTPK
jgi:hypothetical protein